MERIAQVEKEFLVAASALRLLEERLRANPGWGDASGWQPSDATRFSENLEATYIIRLFSEFESGLRDYWKNGLKKTTRPQTEVLLNRIATISSIAQDWLDAVHEIREARNDLVHEHEGEISLISIGDVKHGLCRYFSHLREDW